jgi:hypothetical protein
MKTKRAIAAAGVAILLGGGVGATGFAQAEVQGGHGEMTENMDHGEATGGERSRDAGDDHDLHADESAAAPGSPATEAYRAANRAMHEAMDIEFSDDPDLDFARGMIGHHQGAIDMARIVLEHGRDPDLRGLAEDIIEAQAAEIAFLEAWIAEHAAE